MHFFKVNMLLAILAGSALAVPARDTSKYHLDNDNANINSKILKCTVDCKEARIHENAAKHIAKTAPAGKDIHTKSSYPHIFENHGDAIKWDNQACNSPKVKTLEFPIDETGEIYPWSGVYIGNTLVTKKQEPGPCRVVYSETDRHYCGVMCHDSMEDKENKIFNKCT